MLKPGDQVPLAGVDWRVVVSAEQPIKNALPGAGKPNPSCATFKRKNVPGPDDNAESVGSLITFGRFKTVDLGDLLWDNEFDLMCPNNKIGTVDLYLTSHHGLARSGSEALVHGLQPRVAVMNNGPRKGGEAGTLAILTAHRVSRICGSCTGRMKPEWRIPPAYLSRTSMTTRPLPMC
jgi:hypothetical protein